MDELPADIIWVINLHMDYLSIINWTNVAKRYSFIRKDGYFWENKCQMEFPPIQNPVIEYEEKVYLRLAGKGEKPVPGAERYGKLSVLSHKAAYSDNIMVIKYFHRVSKNKKMFRYLAEQNKEEVIAQLPDIDWDQVLIGAARVGNEDWIKRIIDKCSPSILPLAAEDAAHSGNLSLVKYLLGNTAEKYHSIINKIFQIAAYYNYNSILEFVLKFDHLDYYTAVIWASQGNNISTADKLSDLGKLDPSVARKAKLIGLAKGGHGEKILELFSPDYDPQLIMYYATREHHLSIVEDMVRYGAQNFSSCLMAGLGDIPITQFLIDHGAVVKPAHVLKAVELGNIQVFNLLGSKSPTMSPDIVLCQAAYYGQLEIFNQIFNDTFPGNINRAREQARLGGNQHIIHYLEEY